MIPRAAQLWSTFALVAFLASCDYAPLPPRLASVFCDPFDASGEPLPLLSETGCFPDVAALLPAPDLVPYDVLSPLWTDGADKTRYVVVPPDEQIEITDGRVALPTGTLLIKVFAMQTTRGERALEVRFSEQRADGGLRFFSYTFDNDGAEARRDEGAVEIPLVSVDGGAFDYLVPSEVSCTSCHSRAQPILGFTLPQIARVNDYGPARRSAHQLDAMRDVGLLTGEYDGVPLRDPLADGPLPQRARAWLHANCGHCHQPGGFAGSVGAMDLRFDVPLAETGLCEPLVFGRYAGTLRIDPGFPSDSGIILRVEDEGFARMPPIGLSIADREGIAVVRSYIESLEACE